MNTKKIIVLTISMFLLLSGKAYCMDHEIFHAIKNNDIKKITELLNCGVNINCHKVPQDSLRLLHGSDVWFDQTPLIYAICFAHKKSSLKMVKLFLKYGADITLQDSLGEIARQWAAQFALKSAECGKALDDAEIVGKLVQKNEIDKLCEMLVKEPIYDRYLVWYALFQFHSKQHFKQFEENVKKQGISDVEKLIYRGITPPLLIHFLKKNIWMWNEKMYSIFPTLKQKKEMMIYHYNDRSVASISYDILIKYHC